MDDEGVTIETDRKQFNTVSAPQRKRVHTANTYGAQRRVKPYEIKERKHLNIHLKRRSTDDRPSASPIRNN